MKNYLLTLLLILCAWPGVSTAQAPIADAVGVWGADLGPVPVAAQSGVTAIAVGGIHTVALKNDGSVLAWGYNCCGQTTVPVSAQSGVTAIAAGGYHTVALKNDGSVLAWGNNSSGQTTVPVAAQSGATAIAAGYYHTVVIIIPTAPLITVQPVSQTVNVGQGANFTVEVTGFPLNYQWRKDDADLAGETSPTYSLRFARTNQTGSYTVVVSNPAGSVTSAPPAVLTVNPASPGSVVAWGNNGSGQTTVPITAQSGVIAIAAAGYHTVALKNDGSLVAWGDNYYGETTAPAGLSGVTAIAAGGGHTVALLGTVPLRPSLTSRPRGNELILSWSTNATGFTLQSTLDLTPPAPWIDVTNVPALLRAQWTATNIFSASAQFYRLRKP